MSRYTESNAYYTHPMDSKARRKRLDERRMHFRRAIERYDEQRRLQCELDDYPDLLALTPLSHAPAASRQNARPAH